VLSTSRYAQRGATISMWTNLTNEACQHIQKVAYNRLQSNKLLSFPKGLTIELIERIPALERFVCWSASGCGLRIHKSGGQYNETTSIQIGIANQILNDQVIVCKNIKLQAAKLSLIHKLNLLYKDLEETNLETSHLCHSRIGCWRPTHLTGETHANNIARNSHIGCAGWFWFEDTKVLKCFCFHEPRCEFVRIIPTEVGYGDNLPSLSSSSQFISTSISSSLILAPGKGKTNSPMVREAK